MLRVGCSCWSKQDLVHSLYNEERNLLRIQAKERRNQEAHQERETFPANIPLFGEPYKINKADELSSRIQKMFGNYEEMKELIAIKSDQNLIEIPTNVMSLIPQCKPDRPLFPEKTSSGIPASFQNSNHHHKPLGPPMSGAPSAGNSVHYQKIHSRIESASQSSGLSSNQRQGQELSCKTQEVQSSRRQKKNERCIEEDIAHKFQPSLLELSPLLSTLSSPVAPLSPLHSSQRVNSRSLGSINKNHRQNSSPSKELVAGTHDKETQDSLSAPVAVAAQPSSQTFPSSLSSKPSAIQQKPTAYVRPMDGQDQPPDESPELKPLPEVYHEQSYGKTTHLNASAKTNLPKLKIPAEPIEQSFSNEAHCVEEILKEMTHSWPPPLTAIHTPSTAEPSKFPFPAKETQHGGSVIQSQKQYDAPSKTSIPQQGTSTLHEDLEISDSDDDQVSVSDKPSSSSTPPSAPQSQPESVALAHSSSPESGSTSDSDTSSDSESESSSSESEANDPPTRASTPEPDPQTSNRWQLNNWLVKVNQPVSPTENFLDDDHSRGSLQESKGQGKTFNSNDSSKRECPQPTDGHSKTASKGPWPSQEVHLPTKRNYQKSPAHTEEPHFHQVVGSKQPRKSSRVTVPEEPKRGLTVESEPPGFYGAKDQSSKDKPKVKTKGRLKSGDKKEANLAVPEPSEKKKHKSLHQTTVKLFSDRDAVKDNVVGSTLEQSPLSPLSQSPRVPATSRTSSTKPAVVVREDIHKDKFLLPFRDKKLLSPLRDSAISPPLVVKIELTLLSRVPQPPGKGVCSKRLEVRESHSMKKQETEKRSTDTPSKSVKKRKEDSLRNDQKTVKLDKETKSSSSSGHKDSSKNKISKLSVETQRKEMPLPPPPPPLSPVQPAQKPAKMAQKRPKSKNGACSQPPGPSTSTAKSKESHKDSSSSKHRKLEGKPSESSKSNKISQRSAEDVPNPFPVPSLPNGTSKPTKPQSKPHKQHPVEFHLNEAKRLKHKADAMTDKVGKAFRYLDAALSFIECGIAMESDPLSPKPAYTMFAETIDLIKFIMTLKSFVDSSTTTHEKIFIVFCMRCQAILYMAMFRYKKDTAIKYSRTLNEHFKSSSRITQAPSPCVARSTGTPSPLSPMPSPASSVSSQTGSSASSCGSGSIGSSVNVPHFIPTITSSFVNITSYILYAYDLWEQADVLARKNKKFFSELNAAAGSLSLNSSMIELVQYTRQGLQWLRLQPNTP
ncbi:AF4/FMR2 family member 1 isoform X2 [Rhineura floridana]|uniref:AF4/FMR2 family member 1 isoform X2 n=1 Tax=Rhineura floridana TaxID=261503 RepID=UPI002AC7E9B1|nr:AF4/FMR2 family member 1 isoform X2 [Rhineura floridana]